MLFCFVKKRQGGVSEQGIQYTIVPRRYISWYLQKDTQIVKQILFPSLIFSTFLNAK